MCVVNMVVSNYVSSMETRPTGSTWVNLYETVQSANRW